MRRGQAATVRWAVELLVSVVLVAACAAPSIPGSSIRALGPGEQWLRTFPPDGLLACGGTTAEVFLHGSADDWRLAWMTLPDGTRRQLSWRPGTSARFSPGLEVIGPGGEVLAHEGSVITGSCAVGATDAIVADFATDAP